MKPFVPQQLDLDLRQLDRVAQLFKLRLGAESNAERPWNGCNQIAGRNYEGGRQEMGHPRTDPQFDPLEFERLLNHRMTGALQFGDRMSGGEIFFERKAALGDRIVRRRDADIVGIEQKPLIELSGKLRQETDGDIGLAGFKRFGCVLDRQVQRADRETRSSDPGACIHADRSQPAERAG